MKVAKTMVYIYAPIHYEVTSNILKQKIPTTDI